MKFCPYCGGYNNNPNGNFCENCGATLKNVNNQMYNNQNNGDFLSRDENAFVWGILGFFIPLAGIILFFIWKNEKPNSSKWAGIGALIRIILVIIAVFFIIFLAIFIEPNKDKLDDKVRPYEYRERYENEWT